MKSRIFVFTMLLLVFWIILTATFNLNSLLIGLVCSILVARISETLLSSHLDKLKMSLRTVLRHLLYLPFLAKEIIKANIDVAEIVLDPRLPINPVIIKFRFALEDDLSQIALANSITLTPGTITLDVKENEFYIHCLAEHHATGIFEEGLQNQIIWLYEGKKNG